MARRLRLNTPENTRKTLGRLTRLFDAGEIKETKYRALVYGLSKLLEYFRFEKDIEIEKRILVIEEKLAELNAGKP